MRNMANNSILIVDDEEDICYLLSGILKKKNYEPVFANSLSDALKAIDRSPPSLLILDNRLPDGLGIDFIPYVKEKYPSVKILMVTAYDSASDKLMAYSKGADFFIAKPLNRDLINLAIDQLL
ncbi:MAG TPA: response regulator [Puia sp.]|nr:response regulator [Puia sp.]